MDVIAAYENLISVTTAVYGVEPIRTSPMNLRDELSPPAIALGWSTTEQEQDQFLSEELFNQMFTFAYLGESETALLAALNKLPDFIQALPDETQFNSITRLRNAEQSKSLDYGFTMIIRLKEVI